jgi:hypothetical protein
MAPVPSVYGLSYAVDEGCDGYTAWVGGRIFAVECKHISWKQLTSFVEERSVKLLTLSASLWAPLQSGCLRVS